MSNRVAVWLGDRARSVLLGFLGLTVLFVAANILLDDDVEASQEPDAEVFTTRDDIDRRLPPLTHSLFIVVEDLDGGDILRPGPLGELVANARALRMADEAGELAPEGVLSQPLLFERFDTDSGRSVVGFLNLAEVVDEVVQLRFGVAVENASEDMVKVALDAILKDPRTEQLGRQISVLATRESGEVLGREITIVRSPALAFQVLALNAPLGGGQFAIGPSSDPVVHRKEAFNLKVEDFMRGEESTVTAWGVAAAANETSQEQGKTTAPFIVLAVVTAVLIVGLALRSYWATALTGIGLSILMTWLGGISNLVGLKGGLVIDLLVPISMIALGVDFAVHSISHYQLERRDGHPPRAAFGIGLGAVFSALVLAAATDSAAFASNASSEIESIVHFAIAATIATVSAFVVLGIIAPLALSVIEESLGDGPHRVGRFRHSTVFAAIRVAAMSGGAAIVTLAVSPVFGAVLVVAVIVLGLLVPFRYARRNPSRSGSDGETRVSSGFVSSYVGQTVGYLSSHPIAVLTVTAAITALSVWGALGLQGSFEIEDFFSPDTDFVVSVSKIPEHIGGGGGEQNQILIEGDLLEPMAWVQIAAFVDDLSNNSTLAHDGAGKLRLANPQPLDVLEQLLRSSDSIENATGIALSDTDLDGIPDTSEQVAAAWGYAATHGVPGDDGVLLYEAAEIRTIIDLDETSNDATLFTVQIPNAGDFDVVASAANGIAEDASKLEASHLIDRASATGSGLGRIEIIDASTSALRTSIPIAVLAVFLVLLLGLRSFAYAIASTIPLLLVASWLYGVMALLNLDLNFVTATIGAISIGVGADYSIHMTERYRHERRAEKGHREAARAAAETTGIALLASAASTAVGFLVLALAPMPLFATFGLLTALMVIFALIASLIVLPALLALVPSRD